MMRIMVLRVVYAKHYTDVRPAREKYFLVWVVLCRGRS